MSVILAVPRFLAQLVTRFRRWVTPTPEQRMHSAQQRRQARQQAHDALRDHYPRSGGPGWR